MNLTKMIAELRERKQALEETMIMLERLARSEGKRRGRPPLFLSKTISQASPAGPARPARKRRPFSAETRKRMAASQRKRWAAKKKAS
jgi:hypothetical protein